MVRICADVDMKGRELELFEGLIEALSAIESEDRNLEACIWHVEDGKVRYEAYIASQEDDADEEDDATADETPVE